MTFVLDLDANPHPKLLALATESRERAVSASTNFAAQAYYLGIMHAIVAATGCDLSEAVGWLDHHAGSVDVPPIEVEAMIEAIRLVFA